MQNIYAAAFDELIDMIERSRDECVLRLEAYGTEIKSVLAVGDTRFNSYSTMVATNEARAAKIIEQLAVTLFAAKNNQEFSLYPIAPRFRLMDPAEQAKSRPFQIILAEKNKKTGVVFCLTDDVGYYYTHLLNGDYSVDLLRIVLLIDPDDSARKTIIAEINEYNKKCGIPLERSTIREFWEKHFGIEEYETLVSYLNDFNERVNKIIGFTTVVTPTKSALAKFRIQTGERIRAFPYKESIPDSVYQQQVDIFYRNFIGRGLWKALVGDSNFAISFITSEWNFQMYQLTENLDLTSIVSGYLKSVEQLLWTILNLSTQKVFKIKSKQGGLVDFSVENESIIDNTLGSLEQVVKHNSWMFEVNYHARTHLIEAIDDWREKHRNGYFHKHNLQSVDRVKEIRAQTLQLYFLILGGCSIKDEDFSKLGIQDLE